jgi:hypothetical protein
MTSSPLRRYDPSFSGPKLIPMMALAASKAAAGHSITKTRMQTARQLFET